MIRRNFLKRATGMAMAAPMASTVGSSEGLGRNVMSDEYEAVEVPWPEPDEEDPLQALVSRTLNTLNEERYRKESLIRLPPHIAEKKSWSTAFKYSVLWAENDRDRVPWDKPLHEQIAWLAERGIKVVG